MKKHFALLLSVTLLLIACGENKQASVKQKETAEKPVKEETTQESKEPEQKEDTKEETSVDDEDNTVSEPAVDPKSIHEMDPRFEADTEILDKYKNYVFWGLPWGAKFFDAVDVLEEKGFSVVPSPEADNIYATISIENDTFPGLLPDGIESKALITFTNGRLMNIQFLDYSCNKSKYEELFNSTVDILTNTFGDPIPADDEDGFITIKKDADNTEYACHWTKNPERDSMGELGSPIISMYLSDYGENSENRYNFRLEAGIFGEEYEEFRKLSPGIDENMIQGNDNSSDINKEKYEQYKEYLPKEPIKDAPAELDPKKNYTEHDIVLFRDEWLYGEYYDPDIDDVIAKEESCDIYKITDDWWYVVEIKMNNGDLKYYLMNAYTGDWIDDSGAKSNLDPQIFKQ